MYMHIFSIIHSSVHYLQTLLAIHSVIICLGELIWWVIAIAQTWVAYTSSGLQCLRSF